MKNNSFYEVLSVVMLKLTGLLAATSIFLYFMGVL